MIKEKAVFPMMKHTELINYVAGKIKAKSYLEIGVYNPAHNFDRIEIADKESIDPAPEAKATHFCDSDYFFETINDFNIEAGTSQKYYDIIFIDGLHEAPQFRKDLINSWDCLEDGGVIICHDTNPHSEQITHVPRDQREWSGNVYQAICQVKNELFTLKDDYGVTVIRKTGELILTDDVVNWEEFDLFRNDILNLKTWDEMVKIIDSW